ncbi:MAG: hypothetical protein ACRBM6_08230 [Geminicoccales bacterium]
MTMLDTHQGLRRWPVIEGICDVVNIVILLPADIAVGSILGIDRVKDRDLLIDHDGE